MLAQTGEYLCLSTQTLTLKPVLATSWTPNGNVRRLDVQDQAGGQVPQRPGADRRRRGVHLPAAHQPEGPGERAVRLRRGAPAGRGEEGRRLHGRVPPQRPERELPVPDLVRQLQHDHHSEGLRPGQVAELLHRHRAVQVRFVHAEVRGHVHPQRELLGHQGAAVADHVHLLRHPEPDDPGADRRDHRRGRAVRRLRGAGTAHRQLQHHQAEVGRAPRAVHALRPGPVHRRPGPAGDRAHAEPAADRPGPVQGLRRRGQRQPVRARLPVHRHQRAAADAEHQPRPSRCWPRPGTARASTPSWSPSSSSRSPSTPRSWCRRPRRSG